MDIWNQALNEIELVIPPPVSIRQLRTIDPQELLKKRYFYELLQTYKGEGEVLVDETAEDLSWRTWLGIPQSTRPNTITEKLVLTLLQFIYWYGRQNQDEIIGYVWNYLPTVKGSGLYVWNPAQGQIWYHQQYEVITDPRTEEEMTSHEIIISVTGVDGIASVWESAHFTLANTIWTNNRQQKLIGLAFTYHHLFTGFSALSPMAKVLQTIFAEDVRTPVLAQVRSRQLRASVGNMTLPLTEEKVENLLKALGVSQEERTRIISDWRESGKTTSQPTATLKGIATISPDKLYTEWEIEREVVDQAEAEAAYFAHELQGAKLNPEDFDQSPVVDSERAQILIEALLAISQRLSAVIL